MKTGKLFPVLMVLALLSGKGICANAENVLSSNEILIALNDSVEGEVLEAPEEMATFPGGMQALLKYLSDNLKYPVSAQKEHVSGRVIVQFIIDTEGKVRNVHCMKKLHDALDAEAMRVVKSLPRWQPAKDKGKVVNMKFTLPVTFRLPGIDNKKVANSRTTAVFGVYSKTKNARGFDEYVFGVKDKLHQAFKVSISMNVKTLNPELQMEIAQHVFGIKDDFETALRTFRKSYDEIKIEEATLSDVENVTEYCAQANGVVGIEYRSLVDVSSFKKLPNPEYFLFDTKTNKVVTLEDLITSKLNDYLKSKGVETDKSTNIYIKDQSFVAVTSLSVITMDGVKLKDNLSDYALETLGLTR